MPQYFTILEAEALLPAVGESIRNAMECKRLYQEAEAVLEQEVRRIVLSGGALVDSGRLKAEKSRRDAAAQQLNVAIERIHVHGCEVKDLDIGLIDFRTWYSGEEVYLCWRLGEQGITYWHGLTEGFRGRKKIDEDFLRNHGK